MIGLVFPRFALTLILENEKIRRTETRKAMYA